MRNTIQTETIAKEYGSLVSSLCRRMIFDAETAEEAGQEVWIAILESIPNFRGDSSISTWIYTIAKRVILNHAKNERRYSTRNLQTYFHGPENDFPSHINISDEIEKKIWTQEMCDLCLNGMLHCLDNETRFVFLLRDQMEIEYSEIAHIMNIPEAAIRKSISRSRSKITKFLKGECYLYNTEGSCRCRQIKFAKKYNIKDEYDKIRRLGKKISMIKIADTALPGKDYWKEYF